MVVEKETHSERVSFSPWKLWKVPFRQKAGAETTKRLFRRFVFAADSLMHPIVETFSLLSLQCREIVLVGNRLKSSNARTSS